MANSARSGILSGIAVLLSASVCLGQDSTQLFGSSGSPASQLLSGQSQVITNWPQYGFRPNGGRYNPFETTLSPNNVGKLALRFTYAAPAGLGAPVVAGGMVYFGAGDGNVYALNAETGAFVWKASGYGPAVAEGAVYVMSSDAFLDALNGKTGAQVWSYNIQIPAEVPVVSGGTVYVTAETVAGYDSFALNASTGFLYWRSFIWSNPGLGPPAVAGGVLYVGASGGSSGPDLLALSYGSVLWQYPIEVASSPAVVNGVVYAGSADDNVYALDENTGALLWKYSTAGSVNSSPAVAGGVAYAGSEDGNVYALNASTGALIWKHSVGYFAASPAVANGVVYVVSGDGNDYPVNALDAKTGALLWKYALTGRQPSDPIVVNGMVYFGGADGYLYAFGLPRQ
jgi:outer membrane protein assembly factor BamB